MKIVLACFSISKVLTQSISTIYALCQEKPLAPHCFLYKEACQDSSSKFCSQDMALSVLSAMCNADFKGAAECSKVAAECRIVNCNQSKLIESMPGLPEIVNLVTGICTDMPSMRDCRRCNRNYEAADCDAVEVYMGLCNVHWMVQCRPQEVLCSAAKEENVSLPHTCDIFETDDTDTNIGNTDASNDKENDSVFSSGMTKLSGLFLTSFVIISFAI